MSVYDDQNIFAKILRGKPLLQGRYLVIASLRVARMRAR
jgi:hypothetical protein